MKLVSQASYIYIYKSHEFKGNRFIPQTRPHTFLVVTVKKWLKSVYIYGSYRKIKTGFSLFWTTLYIKRNKTYTC